MRSAFNILFLLCVLLLIGMPFASISLGRAVKDPNNLGGMVFSWGGYLLIIAAFVYPAHLLTRRSHRGQKSSTKNLKWSEIGINFLNILILLLFVYVFMAWVPLLSPLALTNPFYFYLILFFIIALFFCITLLLNSFIKQMASEKRSR